MFLISESERVCPACGTSMEEIGKEVRRTLVMIPAQVKIREDRYYYYTYVCQNCKRTGTETPLLKAPREQPLIPGGYASRRRLPTSPPRGPSFAADAAIHLVVQKFVMYAPLYQQEQVLNLEGRTATATLYGYYGVSRRFLFPIPDRRNCCCRKSARGIPEDIKEKFDRMKARLCNRPRFLDSRDFRRYASWYMPHFFIRIFPDSDEKGEIFHEKDLRRDFETVRLQMVPPDKSSLEVDTSKNGSLSLYGHPVLCGD